VNLGGGDADALARHGVSALLNIAAGYPYSYSGTAAELIAEMQNAYTTDVYQPLASDLDVYNNAECPLP
ncbi:MAG: hypothetical protein GWN07_13720, partial [Actinobacteria bacterium]|nr:hypothetical protein [Actinomycetota bacterium]NIS31401.1 hypothetical protein [Actinomycetota bacterium]NIU66516.1 hypothetical protein [Actinomycetota bacterium]NIW28328.1 hypothetical protein [Actinomycetota bacterium]NIX20827.1 hypothetical protein [Actinomycetota bacterium]